MEKVQLTLDIYPLIFLRCDPSVWSNLICLRKDITNKILGSSELWRQMCLKYFDEPNGFTLKYFKMGWVYGIWHNTYPGGFAMFFNLYKDNKNIIRNIDFLRDETSIYSIRKISENAVNLTHSEGFASSSSKYKSFARCCEIVETIFQPVRLINITSNSMTLVDCNPTRTLYHKKTFVAANSKRSNLPAKYHKVKWRIWGDDQDKPPSFEIVWQFRKFKFEIKSVNLVGFDRVLCTLAQTNQDPSQIF